MVRRWMAEGRANLDAQGAYEDGENKETGRIEAFSDGVLAIAITLLVLDLRLPTGVEVNSDAELFSQLLNLWPEYMAFVISFAFIGIMWINHHRLFVLIKRTDTLLMILNLLLLFGVIVLPFPTHVLADQLGRPGERAAALVYGGLFIAIAIFFNALWRYAASNNRLLDRGADPTAVRKITQQYSYGPLMYLVAFLLAFVNVQLFLLAQILLALFFAVPGPTLIRRTPDGGLPDAAGKRG